MSVTITRALVLGSLVLAAAGCRGRGAERDLLDTPRSTVGGAVLSPISTFLPGVTVTLTDADQDARTVVTSTTGLFSFANVREGAYLLTLSRDGFRTRYEYLSIDGSDEPILFAPAPADDDDSSGGGDTPTLTFVGEIQMNELPPVVTIEPFGIQLPFDDDVTANQEPSLVYDKSVGGDIVITFDRPVQNNNVPAIYDAVDGGFSYATRDPGRRVFTITAATIAGLDLPTSVPSHIQLAGMTTYGPIYGVADAFYSNVHFTVVP